MKKFISGSIVALLSTASVSHAAIVFSSGFESAPAELSGSGTIQSVQGLSGSGANGSFFTGNFLRNDTVTNGNSLATTITLTNLPAHDTISLRFLFAAIDSWDGVGGAPGPDTFNVRIDGTIVFSGVFGQQSGSDSNTLVNGPVFALGTAGFGPYNDRAFAIGANEPSFNAIPHTASTLTIDFFATGGGWQGGDDESFGIDNLEVEAFRVPTPSAAALLGIGGLIATRRKR
jgi:hypothetical protein